MKLFYTLFDKVVTMCCGYGSVIYVTLTTNDSVK